MPIKIGEITLYSVEEIAEKLDVHARTVRTYIKDGKLRGRKAGGKWFVTEEALRAFFEGLDGSEQENK